MRVNGHQPSDKERADRYGAAALARAAERVRHAVPGTRNTTLNDAAHGLAQLIGIGALSEAAIRTTLAEAAKQAGLKNNEIDATLKSAIGAGRADPRTINDRQEHRPKPAPARAKPAPKPPRGLDLEAYLAKCGPAPADDAYLSRKGMAPDGLKQAAAMTVAGKRVGGWLAVPAYGLEGELQSIQFISGDGEKLSAPGHKIGGACFLVNGGNGRPTPSAFSAGEVYLAEGIGTADAAYRATGIPALAAFGKSNMGSVAKSLREHHPDLKIVICPDAGQEALAEAICREIGAPSGWCPMPEGSTANTDLNDLADGEDGLDAVREVLDDLRQPAQKAGRFPIKHMGAIQRNPQTRWAVGNMIPQDIVGEIVAPSTAGKSLFITDIAAHIALGLEWQGNYVEQGAAVFLVGEGENGLGKRRQAWEIIHGTSLGNAPFYYIDAVPNLLDGNDVAAVIDTVLEIHRETPVRLVCVDTKSQHTAGQPEDDNAITAAFIRNLISIRQATGAAVIYTHHTGHSNQERGRGASSAFSNVDLSILMQTNERGVVIKNPKAKDWMAHKPIQAMVRTVELGYCNDQTGEPETSAVLAYEGLAETTGPSKMDKLLAQAISDCGTNECERVRKQFHTLHGGNSEAAQKAFKRSWAKYMAEQIRNG